MLIHREKKLGGLPPLEPPRGMPPPPRGGKNQYGHVVYQLKALDPRNALIPAKIEKNQNSAIYDKKNGQMALYVYVTVNITRLNIRPFSRIVAINGPILIFSLFAGIIAFLESRAFI